ncbi:hypothetical protein [Cytobacillus firmus]|uniref:hypothetical protein n=1 Tax=Cytobacillus firmus TaxID=1399 RepID=UPI0021622422|nr:hypothetical protein [Cytobacillus firmus]MCS0670109.1 hypothetical protein [Cytobacillus firmus]
MKNMILHTQGIHSLRLPIIFRIVAGVVLGSILLPASPTLAHHGWDGFDTNNLVYVAGTVSSDGTWGNPHSHFDITVDSNLPASTPDLEIPEQLQDPEDSTRVNAAHAYNGSHNELEVIIAPPTWSGMWGLDRALEVGERFQGVGYINREDNGLFRPVVFWYGDDSTPVNQVLDNTLPVRAPLLGSSMDSGDTPIMGKDVVELSENEKSGDWVVWAVFGVIALAIGIGGFFYLRRSIRGK